MGRVFAIELEGPVYTCKKCHTHLGVPNDVISKNGPYEYEFTRLFNTFLAERTSNDGYKGILCVCCSSEIGNYGVSDPNSYWVMRDELHGPEGSDDDEV
ncbi:unnamed protein product [Eruca vesicaria subsp. sativa]|uniref:Protein yippee-like n=1 Tax=Eruca vesicaria subsp. sativa TaxID=29727 RepID=A0ABC8JIG3_ERUVS|nr:unnamed protein product [Eruca vesicaria subsp. sativa]